MVLVWVTGFLAGLLHVLTGADHLAAIAPLAVRSPSRSVSVGLRWGAGHASGVGIAFLLALFLREWLSPGILSLWSEKLVGWTLVGLGLGSLAWASGIHTHVHRHDGRAHEHIHAHRPGTREGHAHEHAALFVGVLHGLAGSSHFWGVLPALALPDRAQACVYIASFAAGTVAAMVTFAFSMGWWARSRIARPVQVYRGLLYGCSATALAVGGVWLLRF